jgi:hypothetical protein
MKTYRAVVEAKVPSAGSNGTFKQMVTIPVVPDAGSFYATKALLEASFGPGSVKGLYENS